MWAAATVAACCVVFALALTLSHGARSTVADRLGIGGVDVEIVASPTATLVVPTPGPAGANLDLGDLTTLDAAEASLGFHPGDPPSALYGAPDEVWVKSLPAGKQLTYVYRPRDGLPSSASSGVGLLISQFAGHTNASFIQKQLGADTQLEYVTVNGSAAFWISGAPHVFYYEDAGGEIRQESLRLAGNTLIWEHNGLTLRVEGQLTQAQAIAIAEAMSGP
jgi:hypothetical protein